MSKEKNAAKNEKSAGKEALLQAKAATLLGIPFSPKKQVECSIPNHLAVVLTPKAFGQLFSYAYATQMEVCLLGVVDREGSVFKVREIFLVAQHGASVHTETDPVTIAAAIVAGRAPCSSRPLPAAVA